MGERLTKEREAEIRDAVQSGNENAGRHRLETWCGDLLAEIDALRAAPPTTYLHADGTEEPIGELVARAEKAEADLAETRAKLARLRDAAERFESDLSSFCDGPARDALRAALSTTGPTLAEIRRAASDFREIRPSVDGDLDAAVDRAQAEGCVLDFPALVRLCMDPQVDTLIYAITEAGAVFLFSETCVRKEVAEIRRDAQAEVLRDAVDTACDAVLAAVPCCNGTAAVHAVRRSLETRADDLEAGR